MNSKKMKAAVNTEYGSPDVIKIKDVKRPVPGENDILVKVCASSVSSGDARLRRADPFMVRLFFGLRKPKKIIPGYVFAGIVKEVGRNVNGFKPGDRIYGTDGNNFGCCAEYKLQHESGVTAFIPGEMSFNDAAAIPFGGNTALHFLKKGNIQNGMNVLVYGASGAIGTAAVQIAKYFGADVSGVCSTSNLELVKSLGADKVIDYTKDDFTKSGEKYDIIFDTVGKSPFSGSVNSLDKKGYYLRAVHIALAPLIKGMWVSLTGGKKVIGGISEDKTESLDFFSSLFKEGKFKPVIDRTYPLEQISEAHNYVDTGHKKGNVVIEIDSRSK